MSNENLKMHRNHNKKDFKKNKESFSSDTIEIDRNKIIKSSNKRSRFKLNEAFPILSISLIFIYVIAFGICFYISRDLTSIDSNSMKFFGIATGEEILSGKVYGLITNIFVHRSFWDLFNTLFILIFCGFFIEKYIKRSVFISTYFICIIMFNIVSLFVFTEEYYIGSFTVVSFLIGMSLYFSYRFRRFVTTIDIYIYIALTVIGFFITYMISFYNMIQFILSFLSGIFIIFILDTKCLRENRER